jgi:hypothetical protein
MGKKSVCVFIAILSLLGSGCKSTPSESYNIWVTGLSETATRYYIPATEWQENKNRSISCRPDMTYINESDRPVVCNISFFNSKAVPKQITSISFEAGGEIYLLNDVNEMFTRLERNELRITSTIQINELLNLFQSEKITLKAVIDSAVYTFIPDNEFLQYSRQFLKTVGF